MTNHVTIMEFQTGKLVSKRGWYGTWYGGVMYSATHVREFGYHRVNSRLSAQVN
jgi:hypothetical protein